MQTYEVLVIAYKTVIVEAEDRDEAIEIVVDESIAPYGWERDEVSIEAVLDTEEEIDRAIKNGAEDLRD